jgi:hypothetical protein
MRLPADWTVWEVLWRRKGHVSEALRIQTDRELVGTYSQLRQLAAAGVPANRERGNPNLQAWKKVSVSWRAEPVMVYVLKTSPGEWRLYFIADHDTQRIILLHAVQKKRDQRDPADLDRCQHVLEQFVDPDRGGIGAFSLPSG